MAQAQRAVDRAFKPDNRVATSIAVVEPGTGHVVAIATNRRWGTGGKDRTEVIYATRRAFQSGSTFKPITLATALSQGFSPYTKLDTPNGYVPAKLNYPKGGFNNDSRVGHGFIDSYAAMAASINTYFVRVIERTGVKPVAALARAMGMSALPAKGPGAPGPVDAALTLGAFETSPLEVASAYATLASGGISCRAIFVTSLSRTSSKGEVSQLPKPDAGCRRVLDPAVANTVVDVVSRTFGPGGTARGLEIPGHETFGKTGTTNNSGATWFAGGSPQLTAAVWVGDPRGPTYSADGTVAYGKYVGSVFGRSIAGPIWKEALTGLLAGKPNVRLPATDVPGLVALTPTVVPNVRGMTLAAALDALDVAGVKVLVAPKTAAPDRRFTEGQVVSSDPRPGQLVVAGGSVTLTLSDGSPTKVRTQ
jgi:membrane peptidoglycan carboxypeptidase